MEFNPLKDLLDIIKLVCFKVGNTWKRTMQIPNFFGQHGHVYGGQRHVKTLQILVEFI